MDGSGSKFRLFEREIKENRISVWLVHSEKIGSFSEDEILYFMQLFESSDSIQTIKIYDRDRSFEFYKKLFLSLKHCVTSIELNALSVTILNALVETMKSSFKLEELSFWRVGHYKVIDESLMNVLESLKHCPTFKKISCRGLFFKKKKYVDKFFHWLKECSNIEKLTFSYYKEYDFFKLFEWLKYNTTLKTLDLTQYQWQYLDPKKSLQVLETIKVNGSLTTLISTFPIPELSFDYLKRNKEMHLLAEKTTLTLLLLQKRNCLPMFKDVCLIISRILWKTRVEIDIWSC